MKKIKEFFKKIGKKLKQSSPKQKAILILVGIIIVFVLVIIFGANVTYHYKFKGKISENDKVEVKREDCIALDLNVNSGSSINITKGGSYYLSGETESALYINAPKEKVYLLFDNFESSVSNQPAIYIEKAKKVIITLAKNSENELTSVFDTESSITACVYSKTNLVINGSGSITINGTDCDGIKGSDGLTFVNVTMNIITTASSSGRYEGMKANDEILIENVNLTMNTSGDGIKCDDGTNNNNSYISIISGTLNIVSVGDCLQAKNRVEIGAGEITLKASYNATSCKGIKSDDLVLITGGTVKVTASLDEGIKANVVYIDGGDINVVAEDTIKADEHIYIQNGTLGLYASKKGLRAPYIEINNGTITIDADNKGIASTEKTTINDGTITIKNSTEGIESPIIIINGGIISIRATDDGMNINCEAHDMMGGKFGETKTEQKESGYLKITGGYVYVNASGDGLDSNDKIIVTGGIVFVDGPSDSGNGALDYDTTCKVSGNAILVAIGSSGMAQAPTSSRGHISEKLSSTYSSGTLISILDEDGKLICAFESSKSFNHVVVASNKLKTYKTYTINVKGTIDSEPLFTKFYTTGSITSGKTVATVTPVKSSSNESSMGGGGGMQGGPGGMRVGRRFKWQLF